MASQARSDSQIPLPAMLVKRSDDEGETQSQEIRPRPTIPDLSLEMAQAQLGSALKRTLKATGTPLKIVGDPGQVARVCETDFPPIVARTWMNEERRRVFVKELAKASGLFEEQVTLRERKG